MIYTGQSPRRCEASESKAVSDDISGISHRASRLIVFVSTGTSMGCYHWRSGFHSICSLAESLRRSVEPIPAGTSTPGLSCLDVCRPLGDIVPIFAWELSDSGLRGTTGRTFPVSIARGDRDRVGDSKVSRRGGSMGFFLVSWTGSVFLFLIEPGLGTQSTSAENGLDFRWGFGIYPCCGGCTIAFTGAPVMRQQNPPWSIARCTHRYLATIGFCQSLPVAAPAR